MSLEYVSYEEYEATVARLIVRRALTARIARLKA